MSALIQLSEVMFRADRFVGNKTIAVIDLLRDNIQMLCPERVNFVSIP